MLTPNTYIYNIMKFAYFLGAPAHAPPKAKNTERGVLIRPRWASIAPAVLIPQQQCK